MAKYHTLTKLQWLIWSALFWLFFFVALEDYPVLDAFNYAIHGTLSYAIIIYANALWLMPKLYRQRKYLSYSILVIIMLVGITWLRIGSQTYIYYHYILRTPYHIELKNYTYTFINNVVLFIFSIAFRFTLDFFRIKQQQETLLKQHAEAQLDLLKARVQPHFLFNTLNNIYFVAQRESPLTADLIEKLSSIMRYFLEEGPKQEIPLTAEMDFIRNYIELEKMRIRYPVKTDIGIAGDTAHIRIPPMLLIPLVENVFKHGIDKRDRNNHVSIQLEITDGAAGGNGTDNHAPGSHSRRLQFKVSNSIRPDPGAVRANGSGLKNLTERLRLLYGNDFSLDGDRSETSYTSQLNIPL